MVVKDRWTLFGVGLQLRFDCTSIFLDDCKNKDLQVKHGTGVATTGGPRGFMIRSFDYSRMTRENCSFLFTLPCFRLKQQFRYSRMKIIKERNPREQRGIPVQGFNRVLGVTTESEFQFNFGTQGWHIQSNSVITNSTGPFKIYVTCFWNFSDPFPSPWDQWHIHFKKNCF